MEPERVRAEVVGVYMHKPKETGQEQHFVLFQDETKRRLPIWIGQFEAWAISMALDGEAPERPFTHDAMMLLLTTLGATVEEVCVDGLREETFYSTVRVRAGERSESLDLRPSDAVALALRAKCPIFISEDVMQRASREVPPPAV